MENKKILMIKHSPMNLKFTNAFYLNQLGRNVDPSDVVFVDVTSRNKDFEFIKQISPFYVGPVSLDNGMISKTFENFWQFSKVFKGKTIFNEMLSRKKSTPHEFICSDDEYNPTPEWFRLREFGYNQVLAYRRPYKGETAYFYFEHDGKVERLNYVDSRKKVYIPEYAKLVANSESFKKLKKILDEGKTLAIIDFDAYNYYSQDYMMLRHERDLKKYGSLKYSVNDYLGIKNMKDVVNFPGLLMGHGFVLKMMLQGDIEVKDGQVIDHSGVLN